MRRSTKWFQAKSQQDTLANFAKVRTIVKTGPQMKTEPKSPIDPEGNRYFVVGKSEIGGEEVV
jgi:hypothetical protein